MAANFSLCGICDLRHLSKPSTDWCPECDEVLCSDCKEHHSLSKATRDHIPIPISNYQKMPPFILNIKQYCIDHNKKYVLFCKFHDQPLCEICIKEHSKCGDVMPLQEFIGTPKSSDAVLNLEQNLKDLITNIAKMKANRQDNLATIEIQKQEYLADIQSWREQINQHLDQVEKDLVNKLNEVEQNIKMKILAQLDALNQTEKDVSDFPGMIANMKQYASDLQTFLGIKKIETDVAQKETRIQSLIDNGSLDTFGIVCTINDTVKQATQILARFGTVDLLTDRNDKAFIREKDKQAQILMSQKTKSIDDVKLHLNKIIKTGHRRIRGCVLASHCKLFFINHYNDDEIIVLKPDGSSDYLIPMKLYGSFDVALIDNSTVAVSSGSGKLLTGKPGVNLIDLKTKKITKCVELPGKAYGITCYDGSLICCVADKDIHVISTSDFSVSTIENTTLPSFSYVTADNGKIYYTADVDNTVTCSMLNGTRIWQFKDEKVLQSPQGVGVDTHGNVYVAGELTNNVVVISQDGKQHRQVLGKNDGICFPSALHFERSTNQLLVANSENEDAFLFSIL